ncbi:hypothetical protein ACMHYO_16135 [Allopusillimonas ginsengisoli]|uniref:hypothetical protein n=1 Tax=Allopusillimonas ginsengisoli TaxID=453575 RepID=UPI0039C00C67
MFTEAIFGAVVGGGVVAACVWLRTKYIVASKRQSALPSLEPLTADQKMIDGLVASGMPKRTAIELALQLNAIFSSRFGANREGVRRSEK